MITTIFGTIAFITSVVGLLPQVIKTIQCQSAQDVSMLMLINYLICSLAWILYGYYAISWFVLGSNVLGLLSSMLLIVLKLNYDKRLEA